VGWAVLSALTPLGALPLLAQALGLIVTPFLLARPFWVASDRSVRARLERAVLDLARVAEVGSDNAASGGAVSGR
jgi:ABC-type tungstate transport system substrate-binding protein